MARLVRAATDRNPPTSGGGGCQAQASIPGGQGNTPVYAIGMAPRPERPEHRFAVHPLHNPQRLFGNFQPVVAIINANARDFSVRLIASRDYASFERRLRAGEFDFALANPLQALESLEHGYRLIAKMGDDEHFRGIIIARRDTALTQPADLHGGDMVFPSPTALAAAMMPCLFLHDAGLDVRSLRIGYSGSQESAIMNVYLGNAHAAGTWPMPWELFLRERPELARELRVVWQTESLVNNAIVARKDLPEAHVRELVRMLLGLAAIPDGQAALRGLSLSGFEEVDAEDYVSAVRSFLKRYFAAFPSMTAQGGHGASP